MIWLGFHPHSIPTPLLQLTPQTGVLLVRDGVLGALGEGSSTFTLPLLSLL